MTKYPHRFVEPDDKEARRKGRIAFARKIVFALGWAVVGLGLLAVDHLI
jgi:hypothetical protein